jgi:hypothetical protein
MKSFIARQAFPAFFGVEINKSCSCRQAAGL